MFGSKKNYSKPDIVKIPIDEESLDRVTGGIGDKGKQKSDADPDMTVNTDPLASVIDETLTGKKKSNGSAGNGDVGQGRGRGGGCDGVPYHRNARTFSSGRNSGC